MKIKHYYPILVFTCIILLLPFCSSKKKSHPREKNLIIVLIDALRQDHLGIYGHENNTSPNIDKFASNALILDNAISQSGWTSPSVMALFSSDYPRENLLNSKTYTQWLKNKNYQTTAIVTNPILIPKMGYHQGFETYNLVPFKSGEEVVNLALDWIQQRDKKRPFYLYLHFMDVHEPYTPLPPFDERLDQSYQGSVTGNIIGYKDLMAKKEPLNLSSSDVQRLIDLYDAEIAYLDQQFAALMTGLKKNQVYDNSIIVLLSDHGDEFMEHNGVGHGHTVYDELIRVPLVIAGIDKTRGKRYTGLFELIDLAPTLMNELGIPFNYEVPGMNFNNHWANNKPLKKIAFSETYRTIGIRAGNWCICARTLSDKIIFSPFQKKYELYDLNTDAKEQQSLHDKNFERMRTLIKPLNQWRANFGTTINRKKPDAETLEALRALGYIK